ncbi:hypothetical protein GYMLUDRAFT_264748 [Collybiopsis luxurians FD-317 M1]|uniref:Uncharacterized protein n=1 Tax=Collybiopsis luxurians FD-317 M1 TaxID=944289 RepID=A0A0D0AUL5_9AGAR|nr:hypothetical protein GYMLUDRAFT_264748 [Collybiopsis luxurians FD-317 M1]
MQKAAFYRRTRIQNILLLFIESGAIYCAIQALYAIFTLLNIYGPGNEILLSILDIFSVLLTFASALYPIAVVILINMDNGTSAIESFHIGQTSEGSHREVHVGDIVIFIDWSPFASNSVYVINHVQPIPNTISVLSVSIKRVRSKRVLNHSVAPISIAANPKSIHLSASTSPTNHLHLLVLDHLYISSSAAHFIVFVATFESAMIRYDSALCQNVDPSLDFHERIWVDYVRGGVNRRGWVSALCQTDWKIVDHHIKSRPLHPLVLVRNPFY